jgi:hypothetical protein
MRSGYRAYADIDTKKSITLSGFFLKSLDFRIVTSELFLRVIMFRCLSVSRLQPSGQI